MQQVDPAKSTEYDSESVTEMIEHPIVYEPWGLDSVLFPLERNTEARRLRGMHPQGWRARPSENCMLSQIKIKTVVWNSIDDIA
jgi:hypothetical protein